MNMADVKLLGAWPSPFSYRVIWALKLKGIQYEYIEEDLSNKSALLLQSNPVKKIPVLLHGGKPIAESTIILEYIEETWPDMPLLPNDPYERSIARFWANFADNKYLIVWTIYYKSGEEQEKAVKESLETLRTIEEYGLGENKFFGGDVLGLADLAFGGLAHWLRVIEDVVGIKLLEPYEFPRLHAWMNNFKQVSVIKENIPDHDEMVGYFKPRREMILARP